VDELGQILSFLGIGVSKEIAQKHLQSVNASNDGEIKWPEFLELMSKLFPANKEKLEKVMATSLQKFPEFSRAELEVFLTTFRRFDLDGSNSIDAGELLLVLHFMGQGSSFEQVQKLIAEFDADNSGEIEWEEFLGMMRKFYPNKKPSKDAEAVQQAASSPAQSAAKSTGADGQKSSHPDMMKSPSTMALEANTPDRVEGWLFKLGGRSKNKWQKRWFMMDQGYIGWADQMKGKKKRSIKIGDIVSVSQIPEKVHNKKFCFNFVLKVKTYFCYAETEQEMNKWIKVIESKIK
jgi:Ca2+-binding EF-hand superfamily protein